MRHATACVKLDRGHACKVRALAGLGQCDVPAVCFDFRLKIAFSIRCD